MCSALHSIPIKAYTSFPSHNNRLLLLLLLFYTAFCFISFLHRENKYEEKKRKRKITKAYESNKRSVQNSSQQTSKWMWPVCAFLSYKAFSIRLNALRFFLFFFFLHFLWFVCHSVSFANLHSFLQHWLTVMLSYVHSLARFFYYIIIYHKRIFGSFVCIRRKHLI